MIVLVVASYHTLQLIKFWNFTVPLTLTFEEFKQVFHSDDVKEAMGAVRRSHAASAAVLESRERSATQQSGLSAWPDHSACAAEAARFLAGSRADFMTGSQWRGIVEEGRSCL